MTTLTTAPLELRHHAASFELRESSDTLSFRGYASVFDAPYSVGGVIETVRRGAFRETLARGADCQLNVGHDGLPLARTVSGTLRLTEDYQGLLVDADLDRANPIVAQMASGIRRGDITEMSFAFRDLDPTWSSDWTERTLTRVDIDRGDVAVVAWGANGATSLEIERSLRAAREFAQGRRTPGKLDQYRARVASGRRRHGFPLDTARAVVYIGKRGK